MLEHVDVVGVHGFPLDWNHWQIDEWPDRVAEAHEVTGKPVWVLEVGASSFGAEEVQEFGLRAHAWNCCSGRVERIHWYRCSICRRRGRRRRGIKRPRVRRITGTTTWGW